MIDTIQIAHDLQGKNFTREQAEAIVQTIVQMQTAELTTKTDFADLRTDFAELRTQFAELRGDMKSLRLMVGGVYALLVPILLKLFLH